MACLQEMTILQIKALFPDDNACKAYLASRRWPDGVRCPRCGHADVYSLPAFNWQCHACNPNGYRFSVLIGTIFENTKIPLKDWFLTIHMMLSGQTDVAAIKVQRTIGLGSYRSAWFPVAEFAQRSAITISGNLWASSKRMRMASRGPGDDFAAPGRPVQNKPSRRIEYPSPKSQVRALRLRPTPTWKSICCVGVGR
jgi:transposase-like protein